MKLALHVWVGLAMPCVARTRHLRLDRALEAHGEHRRQARDHRANVMRVDADFFSEVEDAAFKPVPVSPAEDALWQRLHHLVE